MPVDSLTATIWLQTLKRIDRSNRDVEVLAALLEDIITSIHGSELGRILDIHAGRILE